MSKRKKIVNFCMGDKNTVSQSKHQVLSDVFHGKSKSWNFRCFWDTFLDKKETFYGVLKFDGSQGFADIFIDGFRLHNFDGCVDFGHG